MRESSALPTKLGKYEIRTLVGKGSMGMVFLGRDPTLERDVAIKIMGGNSAFDQQMLERFEREAKAVGRLHHPNIVTVHDLGYARDDLPYIAMELLEGSELDALIESKELSLSRRIEILVQVCCGLSHAHDKGVVHRDIKPANIFVTTDGTAKIMDFGVARWTQSSQTQAGLVVGTAGYMAPEQICGQRIDGRADVFSVGAVLYEVLTQRQLFTGDSLEAIFFATLSQKPPVVTLPDGTELPALQKILQRSLAREPANRFQSAEELEDALRSFLHHHAASLPPDTVFRASETTVRSAGTSQRPTVQAPSPTRVPQLRETAAPQPTKPVARRRPTGRARRARRPSRLPIVAVIGTAFLTAVAAGSYVWMLRAPTPPISHASAPFEPRGNVVPRTEPEPDPVPSEPSPSEISATLVADAALALGEGRLEDAKSLIERGETIAPEDSRWAALRDQLRTKIAEAAWKSRAVELVRQGRHALDTGNYQAAIDLFQEAMQHNPANGDARAGLDSAIEAQRQVQTPPRPERQLVESQTEFVSGPSESTELLGFEPQDDLEIKETADPFFPAKVILELDPIDVRTGEPYALRVKVFNEGYRPIELESVELVTRFGDKTTGAGQPIAVRTPTVEPQSTAVLHEISGIWKESQNRAEIEATVNLTEGGKLLKKLSW